MKKELTRTRNNFLSSVSSKLLAATLLTASSVQTVNADTLSFTVGGGMWNETPEGTYFKTSDPAAIDVNKDLFWQEESQGYFFATLEHPVPIIPNARLSYTKLDHSGSGDANFVYDGVAYNGFIENQINIEMLDLLLYYEVLDNVVSVDLGLNVRKLDVDYMIRETTAGMNSDSDSASATIPMVYGLVGFSPIPDLIISGEMSYVAYDGSTISDFTAKIAYTTSFFVGVEAGYRNQKFELDDIDDTNSDLTFDGPFVGAYLKF
jgi:outer membrane protein